jgi:hypothetical protein
MPSLAVWGDIKLARRFGRPLHHVLGCRFAAKWLEFIGAAMLHKLQHLSKPQDRPRQTARPGGNTGIAVVCSDRMKFAPLKIESHLLGNAAGLLIDIATLSIEHQIASGRTRVRSARPSNDTTWSPLSRRRGSLRLALPSLTLWPSHALAGLDRKPARRSFLCGRAVSGR